MAVPTSAALAARIPGVESAEFVNVGGQKAVYKAIVNQQTVALKLICIGPDDFDSDDVQTDLDTTADRAHREVGILDQVDVPVLARTGTLGLAAVEIEGVRWIYFTEEWIDGVSLRDSIHQGPLSPVQVARLGVDLVQAVCWLAERGLVHRDIKPENIIWSDDRARYVLLDPGIALDLDATSLTRLPAIVGTMAYLSPEQSDPYRTRRIDFRSDLFAVGVVLYEASVGEHPFMTMLTTPSQVLAGILTVKPPSVSERRPKFPMDLSDLIARLLGKAPHQRYRTCDRARSAVEDVARSLGVTP